MIKGYKMIVFNLISSIICLIISMFIAVKSLIISNYKDCYNTIEKIIFYMIFICCVFASSYALNLFFICASVLFNI